MTNYIPAESEMICRSIEEYGARARVALRQTDRSMFRSTEADPFSSPPTHIANAADLAVVRIRELEASVKSLHEWQDDLLAALNENEPIRLAAENWMGWRLLCEGARDSYQAIFRFVSSAHAQRKSDERDGPRPFTPPTEGNDK